MYSKKLRSVCFICRKLKKKLVKTIKKTLLHRRIRLKYAASSVLETLLLLSMTIGFFSVLYLSVFNFPFSSLPPSVHIIGTTSEDAILLYHRGGVALNIESVIVLTIGNVGFNFTVGDCLDEAAKIDKQWNMGEQLVISGYNCTNQVGEIKIIDRANNVMVFHGYL